MSGRAARILTSRRYLERRTPGNRPSPQGRPLPAVGTDGPREDDGRVPGALPPGDGLARDLAACGDCGDVELLAPGSPLCSTCEELSRAAATLRQRPTPPRSGGRTAEEPDPSRRAAPAGSEAIERFAPPPPSLRASQAHEEHRPALHLEVTDGP